MTDLHNLRPAKGSHRVSKRLGQGPGSGTGKTAGKGHKGSKARTGHHGPGGGKAGFEGGQMPLYRRIPKRGFTPLQRNEFQVVNLYQVAALAETEITAEVLKAHGLISKLSVPVKILGVGELAAAKTVTVSAFSKSAKEKIEAAGGQAVAI